MGQGTASLAENFLQYFDVVLANDRLRRNEAFKIRYNVYCEEFGYEPASAFPDKMEWDEFDEKSDHALIIHKSSNRPAGCVRLVGAEVDTQLPFEMHCGDSLDREFISQLGLSRNRMCEISRLAVDSTFRRRPGELVSRYGEVEGLDCTQQERRTFSLIAVSCFLAATALTDLTGRNNVFAMMEPFLPRLLQRSGILFQRSGWDIDYHGLRAPYFIKTEAALENMREDLKELYAEIYRVIASSFVNVTEPSAASSVAGMVPRTGVPGRPFPAQAVVEGKSSLTP